MSSAPQAPPAVQHMPKTYLTDSSFTPRSQTAFAAPSASILLVGRNGSWGTLVLKSLEKSCGELFFVTPQTATPEFARNGAYTLILLDSTVLPEQRRLLTSELIGSNASIFYTFPVENGCWWLPALQHGKDCHGAPAFRRHEFLYELERIVQNYAEA